MPSLPSLLFVFEDDEIKILGGDCSSTTPGSSIQDHFNSEPDSISHSDVNDIISDTPPTSHSSSSPHPEHCPTTPPPPPPKLPPSRGNRDLINSSQAEYNRSVLFPELYGLPPPVDMNDPHDGFEDSLMPRYPDTFLPRDSEEFEALHSEFMDLIQLSGRLAEDATSASADTVHPFAAPRQSSGPRQTLSPRHSSGPPSLKRHTYCTETDDGSEMPPPSDVPSDVEPDTPQVTEPLHIRKRGSPTPRKRRTPKTIENDLSQREQERTKEVPHLDAITQRIYTHNKRLVGAEGDFGSALPTRHFDNDDGHYAHSPGQAEGVASGGDTHAYTDDEYLRVEGTHEDDSAYAERAPSPSPPLIRTPDTPPVATLPESALGFFPKAPTGSIHARREANRLGLALRDRNRGNGNGESGIEAKAAQRQDSQESEYSRGVAWPFRPSPAIVIPPLDVPIPPIALGPLPPLPGGASASAAPKSPGAFPKLTPPPPPSPANLSPPLTGTSDSPRSVSGFSINRPGLRRPASMQPHPSPREFVGGPLTRARDAALAGGTNLASPTGSASPGLSTRPASAISYHFGGITIPGSSPVVQAFEDIGAMGIIGPTSPFTHPRLAPRPSGLGNANPPSSFGYYDFLPPPGLDPESPATPTSSAFISSSPPAATNSGNGEVIPAKARALLGLYASLPDVTAAPKKSKFKMSDFVRGVGARNAEGDPQRSPEAPARGRGLLSRRRSFMVNGAPERDIPAPPRDKSPGDDWRVGGDSASIREWNDPDNFAPLTGYAAHKGSGSMSRLPLGTSFGEGVRDRERGYERRPERDEPARHGHKASFGSANSFPVSVTAESTYPSSVLSKKSSFEVPRGSPQVFASPKVGASSFKSSVDGNGYSAAGSLHKPKLSLEGIPNLTPNSKPGQYAPAASDSKWFKNKGQFHAPSLSPIVYTPPRPTKTGAPNYPLPPLPHEEAPMARSAPTRVDQWPSPRSNEVPLSSNSDSDGPLGKLRRNPPPPIKVQRTPRSVSEKHSAGSGKTSRSPPSRSHHPPASVATPSTAPVPTSSYSPAPSHKTTSSADRYAYARHVPTNLHLRHPTAAEARSVPPPAMRPRVPSRASLIEESYFEPDTPSPKAPGHFRGLRNAAYINPYYHDHI